MMKKILIILLLMMLMPTVNAAMSYKDAYTMNNSTPMAVFVYADWATNYEKNLTEFRKAQQELGDKYNYVELDIASNDAKAYTEQNAILPKLPYIMLYRGKCKFARLIDRSCASDEACILSKMKSFMRQ